MVLARRGHDGFVGPTWVRFALVTIDAVVCDPAMTTDQRRASRARGAACDIGATDTIFTDRFETMRQPGP